MCNENPLCNYIKTNFNSNVITRKKHAQINRKNVIEIKRAAAATATETDEGHNPRKVRK